MMRSILLVPLFLATAAWSANTLDIYFVDVEGGQATLIVTPQKESILVDAGWPRPDKRDAKRIAAAAQKAGIKKIDYVVVSHYHLDHIGGVEQLSETIPVGTFVDHGPNTEKGKSAEELSASYARAVAKGKHLEVKPGDTIPLKGAKVTVVTARGQTIEKPLTGGGPNAACKGADERKPDTTENAKSVGIVVEFGKFRFVDLGDLTWNKELELACPDNKVGPIDVYLTTHHGMDASGATALVQGIKPRVAIMNNGAKKGGSPEAWKTVKSAPGLEDFWQVHTAIAGGKETNVAEDHIANLEEDCKGLGLKVSAAKDGSFKVENERNGVAKSYGKRS
jgi:beta-lactamase superfamily II metal-dependent hydrolase